MFSEEEEKQQQSSIGTNLSLHHRTAGNEEDVLCFELRRDCVYVRGRNLHHGCVHLLGLIYALPQLQELSLLQLRKQPAIMID